MVERTYSVRLQPMPKHYVYIHFHPQHPDEENCVVYVGVGTDRRAWSRRERSDDHSHWMRDWQDLGYTPDQFVKVVRRKMTKEQALKFERQLIKYYLTRGCSLFNKEKQGSTQQRQYTPFFPDVKRPRSPKRK